MNRTRSVDLPRTHVRLLAGAVPALVLLFLLCTSTPAAAHFLYHHDRNDSKDGLDLRAVHLWEYPQVGLFSLVVHTYDPIRLGEHGRFIGWFDSFGDGRWDYALVIGQHLCKMIARTGGSHTSVFATRVDPRKAHCLFQVHKGFRRTKHMRLRVWSRRVRNDGLHLVVDKAPDAGWYAH
jgi:hypothetical protein